MSSIANFRSSGSGYINWRFDQPVEMSRLVDAGDGDNNLMRKRSSSVGESWIAPVSASGEPAKCKNGWAEAWMAGTIRFFVQEYGDRADGRCGRDEVVAK